MRKPKSKLVKKLLKTRTFSLENLALIEDLLEIEAFVLDGYGSAGEAGRMAALLNEHYADSHTIYQELDPKGYPAFAREQKLAGELPFVNTFRLATRLAKDRWKKIGGRA